MPRNNNEENASYGTMNLSVAALLIEVQTVFTTENWLPPLPYLDKKNWLVLYNLSLCLFCLIFSQMFIQVMN